MTVLKETVFAGRDNVVRLELKEDSVLFQLAYPAVTPSRWVLTINTIEPIEIDSDDTPSAFDWDSATSILELRIGDLVTEAVNYTSCTLVMYAIEWPLGLVWINPTCTPDKLTLRICDNS